LGLIITGFALADELGVGVGLVLAGVSFTGGAGGNLTTGGVITGGVITGGVITGGVITTGGIGIGGVVEGCLLLSFICLGV